MPAKLTFSSCRKIMVIILQKTYRKPAAQFLNFRCKNKKRYLFEIPPDFVSQRSRMAVNILYFLNLTELFHGFEAVRSILQMLCQKDVCPACDFKLLLRKKSVLQKFFKRIRYKSHTISSYKSE